MGDFGLATVRTAISRTGDGGTATPDLRRSNDVFSPAIVEGGGGHGGTGTGSTYRTLDTDELPGGPGALGVGGGSGSITGGVGTTYYIAPEQNNTAGTTRYDQKADMYSLGIVLFEMAHAPFSTMMERAKALTALRTQQTFPPDFAASAPPLIQKVILQVGR